MHDLQFLEQLFDSGLALLLGGNAGPPLLFVFFFLSGPWGSLQFRHNIIINSILFTPFKDYLISS